VYLVRTWLVPNWIGAGLVVFVYGMDSCWIGGRFGIDYGCPLLLVFSWSSSSSPCSNLAQSSAFVLNDRRTKCSFGL
jgi:hypothetical protein